MQKSSVSDVCIPVCYLEASAENLCSYKLCHSLAIPSRPFFTITQQQRQPTTTRTCVMKNEEEEEAGIKETKRLYMVYISPGW